MNGLLITLLVSSAAAFASAIYGGYPMKHEDTFLVTMKRAQVLEIVSCVADSRDPQICQQYTKCLTMFPSSVLMAYKKCRQAYFGVSWPQCYSHGKVFPPAHVRGQIFDCIDANTPKLMPTEEMAVAQAESCLRHLYSTSCMHQPKHHGYY